MTVTARFKLWLETDEGETVFGWGKWQLLEAIDRTGSLSAAAETLGISYRKAWGDIRKAEQALGVSLLDRQRGGRDGGETRLTSAGRRWTAEYRRFQAGVESAVQDAYVQWQSRMCDAQEQGDNPR